LGVSLGAACLDDTESDADARLTLNNGGGILHSCRETHDQR